VFNSLIVDGSPDLHTIATVDGFFIYVSAASYDLFGWDPSALVGESHLSFTHPDDVALVDEARKSASKAPDSPVTAARFRCADGTYRWTEGRSRLVNADGEWVVLTAIRDNGAQRKIDLDLQRQASTDPLTGLANRTLFMDRLRQALRRLERQDGFIAVLFIDLDRFKLINDSVGHHMGDEVLLQVADRLHTFLRPADTLARLGGDEFVVVVEDIASPEAAVALAGRIVETCRAPFNVDDEQFTCTASVGITVTADALRGADGLVQEADLALYQAKDRGRDRAELFDEELRTRAVGRLGRERMLRRAIDEDRLRMSYQPIIDLQTGDTVAVEALVRVWDPVASELIAAESFIEVAEETGLLATMDIWVLGQAIKQAVRWREMFTGTGFADVAINVTARHLADPSYAQSVIDDLAAHDLPAGTLQIEVTERVLLEATTAAMSGLKLLRSAGVRVGLDDFGTGYSSLSYLRLFPLDFVKIDRSFIQGLGVDTTERAIVASIIDLSHALGMAVVAEGVETQGQLDMLVELGCDRAQGYLFATSGPPEDTEALVLRPSAGDVWRADPAPAQ